MIMAVVLTVLVLPLALGAAKIGRPRWIRCPSVAQVRAELAFFHHGLRDMPSGRHRLTRF